MMADKHFELFSILTELECNIVDKVEILMQTSWDADTLRREIELMIMERRKVSADFNTKN